MNRSETAKLLAKAQLIDNRTVDRATVEAWHEAIGHQDYAEAMEALFRHRQTSTDWLEPAHINALVPVIRRERMRDGLVEQAKRALPPPPVEGPPEWFSAEAGMRVRPRPPAVECPWCGAAPSEPCTVRGTDKPLRAPHPSRLEAVS
jgi:hypothetical protein